MVAALLDGEQAFFAAIVGHEQVIALFKILRDDQNGAFGVAECLMQIGIRLPQVDVGIEQFSAQQQDVSEPGFFDEKVFVPLFIVGMDAIFDIMSFALFGE